MAEQPRCLCRQGVPPVDRNKKRLNAQEILKIPCGRAAGRGSGILAEMVKYYCDGNDR